MVLDRRPGPHPGRHSQTLIGVTVKSVLILTSIVSDTFAYSPGDKVSLADAEATRLINGGFALPLIQFTQSAADAISAAADTAGLTVMASGGAAIPAGGGYYFDSNNALLHVVHPSGGAAVLDPLHMMPRWSR
jgi:hypothetical protein